MSNRAGRDAYGNDAELRSAERESADYRVRAVRRERARTLVVAPHGGGIEPGTSEVACGIAGDDLSLALFEGLKPGGNRRLHVTSTHFDEPRCLELLEAADCVVAIHGERGESPMVYLGGRDMELGKSIQAALLESRYAVAAHENPALQGFDPRNICNRGQTGAGVQLELSAGLRRTFFAGPTHAERARPTRELERFTKTVREGLRKAGLI
ncbi:MAG: poly-gamma-glutamate hydrolase family protein [Candidatus Eisenbacteria bacterium]